MGTEALACSRPGIASVPKNSRANTRACANTSAEPSASPCRPIAAARPPAAPATSAGIASPIASISSESAITWSSGVAPYHPAAPRAAVAIRTNSSSPTARAYAIDRTKISRASANRTSTHGTMWATYHATAKPSSSPSASNRAIAASTAAWSGAMLPSGSR